MEPCRRNIAYGVDAGDRHLGDLFLPQGGATGNPVLLIHGGGWNALSKESFEFMAPFFLSHGRPVFCINYRLLGDAPWPACGDDCLAAARFMLDGGLQEIPLPGKLLICGGSAGGHLAMMTGLRLPQGKVEAILSLSGPVRLDWVATTLDPQGLHEQLLERFFGKKVELDGPEVRAASPRWQIAETPPDLFCIHSRKDRLIPPRHSLEAVAAWRERGGRAELREFDGDGELHGFWVNDDRESNPLNPALVDSVNSILEQLSS
jgi:acetyl esterase/lipase